MAEKVVDQITELWNEFTKAHNASEVIDAKRVERLTRKEVKSIISDIRVAKELNGFVATKLNEQVTKLNALIDQKQPKGDASLTFDDEDILFDMVNRNLWMYEQLLKALREYFGHDTSDSALVYAGTRDDWKEACKDAGEFIEFEHRMAKFTSMILAAVKASAKLDVMFDDLLGVLKGGDRFTALPNESIYRVLEYISFDDLCAVSRSCKRLQELSGDFFQRNYSLVGRIGIYGKGEIGFLSKEKYVEYFSSKLQRIEVLSEYEELNDEVLQFMRKNCSKNIKEIHFDCAIYYSKSFLEGIKTVLNNVETIIIHATDEPDTNLQFDVLLNDLPLLKHLEIQSLLSSGSAEIESLKRVKCPQLESLSYISLEPLNSDALKVFFQQNPTVTRLVCPITEYMFREKYSIEDFLEQILTVVSQSASIEELIIKMDRDAIGINFSSIRNQLKMLNESDTFKRFSLEISTKQMFHPFELAVLKSFSYLRLTDAAYHRVIESDLQDFNKMIHLEVLELCCGKGQYPINEIIAVNLSQSLTNLKKLILIWDQSDSVWFKEDHPKINQMDVLKPFVRNTPKLTEIEFKECKLDAQELTLNVQVLIDERKKLKNAEKLVIFIPRFGQTIPAKLRKSNNDDLVVLKEVREAPKIVGSKRV